MPDDEYSVKIYAGGQYIASEENCHYSASGSVAGNTIQADGNEVLINHLNERMETAPWHNPAGAHEGQLKIEVNEYANMDQKDGPNQVYSFDDTPSRINQNASGFPYGTQQ